MDEYNRDNTVIISVRSGMAKIEYTPDNIKVLIIDYDSIARDSDHCPVCHEDISENEIGICDGCGFDLNNDFSDISIDAILDEHISYN
jgi:hypothetical protein